MFCTKDKRAEKGDPRTAKDSQGQPSQAKKETRRSGRKEKRRREKKRKGICAGRGHERAATLSRCHAAMLGKGKARRPLGPSGRAVERVHATAPPFSLRTRECLGFLAADGDERFGECLFVSDSEWVHLECYGISFLLDGWQCRCRWVVWGK